MVEDADTDEDLGVQTALPALALDSDQAIRAFVFKHYASSGEPSSIDGRVFVLNCDYIMDWIKGGKVPRLSKDERARLTSIEGGKK